MRGFLRFVSVLVLLVLTTCRKPESGFTMGAGVTLRGNTHTLCGG